MNKNVCLKNHHIFLFLILLSLFDSCQPNETYEKATIETDQVSLITEATALCGGIISADGGSDITKRGVCWSSSPNPTIENDTTIDAAGTGRFSSLIKGLSPGTTYYVRAYAVNKGGIAYGLQVVFTTKTFLITTSPIATSLITATSAIGGGIIQSDGDSSTLTVIARGVCWNTFSSPTIENSKTVDGRGGGRFTSHIDSLAPFTTYFVRAYATNVNGTIYGDEISFTTKRGIIGLTTDAVSSITAYTAIAGGGITYDGGSPVTECGVCWSTSSNPTTEDNKLSNSDLTGDYSINIAGLMPGTTYYLRTYAINHVGTSYGNEVSFTTQNGIIQLTTNTATLITAFTATSGGNIASDGGAPVSMRGVCWSTTPNPTTFNSKTTDGSGLGDFSSNLTNLSVNTPYYVRSYAVNSVGISYGNEVVFSTKNGVVQLTTSSPSMITAFTAKSGGTITSDGGAPVITRGVCWSTSPNPTTSNSITSNENGLGNFSSDMTDLAANTPYYVRSYAINSVGTSYGNEVGFTTQDGAIQMSTNNPSVITSYTAISGGLIDSDGGSPVLTRGVCWSTSPTPTTSDNKTIDGSGVGSFSSKITGLSANTVYYTRSYAINKVGTSYGNEISYRSQNTLSDIDGNVYQIVKIGTQTWMVENLKTTKLNDGTLIPLISENSAWSNLASPGYCYFNNDISNNATFGVLYNWFTINTGKLAPTGWRVPSNDDWIILEKYLIANGYNFDGTTTGNKIAKSMAATSGWASHPTLGAIGNNSTENNLTGFAGFPGGYRNENGSFGNFEKVGYWWSSTKNSPNIALSRVLTHANSNLATLNANVQYGFSVRCIKID